MATRPNLDVVQTGDAPVKGTWNDGRDSGTCEILFCVFIPSVQKIDEREALVRQRMVMETSKKDPSRLLVKCSSVTERRQQQKM